MNAQCISVCKVASTSASLTQCSCLNATAAFLLTYHNIHNQAGSQSASAMPVLPAAADAPTQVSSTLTSCCLQTDAPMQATASLQAITLHHSAMLHA